MGSIKIRVNNPGMTAARLKTLFYGKALPVLAEQIKTDCNTYAREQSGDLKESAGIEAGGRRIVWSTGYAKKVYYSGTPRRNKNPNASLRWCEVAKRAHGKEWAAMATKLMGGG